MKGIITMNNENKNIIPVFFTIDDGYAPFLSVALASAIKILRPTAVTAPSCFIRISARRTAVASAHLPPKTLPLTLLPWGADLKR